MAALAAALPLLQASAGELALFDRFSWPARPSAFLGAELKGDFASHRRLAARFAGDGSGVQIRVRDSDRPACVADWFADGAEAIVDFIPSNAAAAPEAIRVEILAVAREGADDSDGASRNAIVASWPAKTSGAETLADGSRRLRLKLRAPAGLSPRHCPEVVKIIALGEGALAVTHIAASGPGVADGRLPVPPMETGEAAERLWLRAKGRRIVASASGGDGAERAFVAAGAGYCKDVILRGYDDLVAEYCKRMGLNTIRLAFYTQFFNSRADSPLGMDDIAEFVDPVIAAARRHGLYVILDDHVYFRNEIDEETARGEQKSAGWTQRRFEEWTRRWGEVAERYRDEPRILGYELCNEPVCEPEVARRWYKRAVDEIRRRDTRHIVILGAHHWSHSRSMEDTWSGVADKIDAPFDNAVFSFHDYPMDDEPVTVKRHIAAFQRRYRVPVMCTEFGAGGTPERVHREGQAGMLALFAKGGIGWMIWALQDRPDLAYGSPTVAVKADRRWEQVPSPKERYWIPYPELWSPVARIVASPVP